MVSSVYVLMDIVEIDARLVSTAFKYDMNLTQCEICAHPDELCQGC